MSPDVSRRSALRGGALIVASGLAGCASTLDHPDLRLRNSDGDAHELSIEITRVDSGKILLSKTFELGRETVDTTVDPLFEEGARYSVGASFGSADAKRDTWEIDSSNPKYHVTIHGDEDEPYLTLGRLGGF